MLTYIHLCSLKMQESTMNYSNQMEDISKHSLGSVMNMETKKPTTQHFEKLIKRRLIMSMIGRLTLQVLKKTSSMIILFLVKEKFPLTYS